MIGNNAVVLTDDSRIKALPYGWKVYYWTHTWTSIGGHSELYLTVRICVARSPGYGGFVEIGDPYSRATALDKALKEWEREYG